MTGKHVGVCHCAAHTVRAKDLINWKPEYFLQDGMTETIDRYSKNRDRRYVRENLKTLLYKP